MPSVAVSGTNGKVVTGLVYRIVSSNGAALDDYGGKTGLGTASLAKDNGDLKNRIWELIPAENPFYRIRSSNNTALDDWGGAYDNLDMGGPFGWNIDVHAQLGAASLAKDNGDTKNRSWKFIPAESPYFRIVSSNNMALDDWGGAPG